MCLILCWTTALDGLTEADLAGMLHFANTAAYLVTTRKGAIRSLPSPQQIKELLLTNHSAGVWFDPMEASTGQMDTAQTSFIG